jgi:ATP-dependent DNA helicase PIF1
MFSLLECCSRLLCYRIPSIYINQTFNNPCLVQSLKNVGVYLLSPVFSHGQLYVAISRVTSRDGLKMLINDEGGQDTDVTSNVVYIEVFRNV